MAFTGTVLALDISKNRTGVAHGRVGQKPAFEAMPLGLEDDDFFRPEARAIEWIAQRLYVESDLTQFRIAIEAPMERDSSGGSNIKTILGAFSLCKAIGGFAQARGVMVRVHKVQTIRKAFLGRGNLRSEIAKREAIRVCRALGWQPQNHDMADAGALWWFACQQWAPELNPDVRAHRYQESFEMKGVA